MSTLDKAIELQTELIKLEKRKIELLGEMQVALKIKKIWPDAFAHGAVSFRQRAALQNGRDMSPQQIVRAFFVDGAGTEFDLTREQMEWFKPDTLLHKDFGKTQHKV